MAVRKTLPLAALKELEQQLICAVCLDVYSSPKSLPCLHSFCQSCLEGLLVNPAANKFLIKCPTCSTTIELSESTGPAAFPVAFHLNSLKEVYSLMKQETAMNCSKHDDPLKMFCESCEKLICRDCTIGDHKTHDCKPIKDSYDKHRQVLEASLGLVKRMIENVVNAVSSLKNRENEIRNQGEIVKQEIHSMAEEMIEKIRQSERRLAKEVDTTTDSKLHVITGQRKAAEMSFSRLKDCKEFVVQSLKTSSHQQVLMSKKRMMEHMNQVTKGIKIEEYNPIEKADIQFIKSNKMELNHIGDIVCTTVALQQCKVKKISRHQVNCEKGTVSFALSLELPNSSSLLTVPLSSLSCSVVSTDNTPINTTVSTTDHPGVYKIHCSPTKHGPHQVNIQVNNVQLESTSVVIPFNPYLAKNTSTNTVDGLEKPYAIAASDDGHFVVTENFGNCITLLDKKGKKVKSFTNKSSKSIKISSPRGVAITPDNFILVTDEHKIQKLTMNGKFVASVGQHGSKPLEFNAPEGIAISPTTAHIYVADCNNHRIQVLNPDLTYRSSFGSYGSAKGQFIHPHFIALDNQGSLYISDSDNHRIQVFTSEGKYRYHFGTRGSDPGQLQYPTGIAVNNNLLYVVEDNSWRVSIFTTDGQFISSFGRRSNKKDDSNLPRGIILDNDGYLHICDFGKNRIVTY